MIRIDWIVSELVLGMFLGIGVIVASFNATSEIIWRDYRESLVDIRIAF